jgi:hypothetical protein
MLYHVRTITPGNRTNKRKVRTMTKTTTINIRATEQEAEDAKRAARVGGWKSVADMVRAQVAQVLSQQPHQPTEQSQPDRP